MYEIRVLTKWTSTKRDWSISGYQATKALWEHGRSEKNDAQKLAIRSLIFKL